MQVTLGTLANVSMGLAYDIHLGDKVKVESNDKVAFRVFTFLAGGILIAGALAFQLAYDQLKKDDQRANLVILFQIAVQAIVAALMAVEIVYYEADHNDGKIYKDVFGYTDDPHPPLAPGIAQSIITSLLCGAGFGGAILPPIMDSSQESYLDQVLDQPSGTQGSGAYMKVPTSGTGS